MNKNGEKVTIFYRSENSFLGNVRGIEGRLTSHGRRPYAQYRDAIQIVFTPKGARLKREIIAAYHPYILIVKGWGHDEVPSPFRAVAFGSTGIFFSEGKHMSHSDAWISEFETWLAPRLAGMEIVVDYRGTSVQEKVY